MRSYKTEGIILARRSIGEADRLITIFTKEYGKKIVIAKGIRRITSRRAPHLELFSYVSLVLHQGKTFDVVTEVVPREAYPLISTRLERIGYVYIVLELIDKLTAEHQESFFIFEKLQDFLRVLNAPLTTREQAEKIVYEFKHYLLSELGFIKVSEPLSGEKLDQTIEEIVETTLKSPRLLTTIQQGI